jgi:hypothetical protein
MTELSDAATRTLVRAVRYAANDADLDATIELGDLPPDELDATYEVASFLKRKIYGLCEAQNARANAAARAEVASRR